MYATTQLENWLDVLKLMNMAHHLHVFAAMELEVDSQHRMPTVVSNK
jgi:hypothetical protein